MPCQRCWGPFTVFWVEFRGLCHYLCGVTKRADCAPTRSLENEIRNTKQTLTRSSAPHQVVKMAERLCAGRVVSVVERHSVAATGDTETTADADIQEQASAAGTSASTGPTDVASRGGTKSNGKMDEIGGKSAGCHEGREGNEKTEKDENTGATAWPQKEAHDHTGGESGAQEPWSSELECLKGHIRGLRAGCAWFAEEKGRGVK